MKIDKKIFNSQLYNFSKDSRVLFYDDNDNNLNTLFYMINEFIDIDNVAGFVMNQKNEIIKYNDVHHLLFDDAFFDNYNCAIKKSNDILESLKDYFKQTQYCHVCSLTENDNTFGYLIFYRKTHSFNENEKKHFNSFASIYNHHLLNVDYFNDSYYKQSIFQKMMNEINSNIYVSNPETYEILFMNETMKNSFNIDNPIGKVCWKVIQNNQDGPCTGCPIPFLSHHSNQQCTWESVNAHNQKTYRNYDCFIDWFDHSTAHFQHSVDITEFKQISHDAKYDELTKIYNRKAGKEYLQDQIIKATTDQKNVVVALYDIDNLKLTNDVFGHVEGDHMIKVIADAIKPYLRDNDIFFRLSGDEFIVSFYNCTIDLAHEYMRLVLRDLNQIAKEQALKYELSYCFGLYQVKPDNILGVNDIIMNADEKMYEWKKRAHLRIAQKQLLTDLSSDEFFEYDESLLYSALVKSTDDYIFICNMKTGVFRYTPEMVDEFNFPSEILHNAAAIFGSKIHKDDKYVFLNGNQQITDGKSDSHIVEYRALNKNNDWVWLRCRGHVEYDNTGEPALFAGFISNLGKKNYRDILTGLYNKFEFEKRISETIGEFSIMILNIDDFKSINSLYNREFGDTIIRIIAQDLLTLLSKEATVFKLEGDEFGLIIKKANKADLKLIFKKIQTYVSQQHSYEEKPYSFSITAGSASAPQNGDTYLKLQRNCEIALQYGKHNRRGKLTVFNNKIFTEKTFDLELLNILKQDMNNDFEHFSLVYQPIIDADQHNLMKAEALCRWNHHQFSNVGPGYFIPLLEDTGDIIKLGKWIFKKAIIQLKDWLIYNPQISVSINVSYIQLIEKDFVSYIKEVVNKYNVPYNQIVLELTETAIAKNAEQIIDTIRTLRDLGIQIAMDDFGTGYSSLSLLKDEPCDIIKIDQSFVRGIENDSFNQIFIKLIIELCHQIGLYVLIEGVETKKELDLLLPLKPDFIQGYYTGMPMAAEDLIQLIKNKKND